MKFLAVIFVGLVAISSGFPKALQRVPGGSVLIVGGQDATEGQFSYQISLLFKDQHICGGSIISPSVIVTAAHCVARGTARDYKIVAGQHDRSTISGHEQTIQVIRIITHEQYNNGIEFSNDIALLVLSSVDPLQLNQWAQPVALPTAQEQPTTEDIIVSGWGTTSSGGSLPNILQFVQIPIVDDDTCQQNYPFETILPSMICAGEGGKDSCQGDSGGPLVTVNSKYLAAIVSWGYGCAVAGYPGVNTEVSYYVNWINDKISGL